MSFYKIWAWLNDKPRKDVGFRVISNLLFWLYICFFLVLDSERTRIVLNEHIEYHGLQRILEYADERLWLLQVSGSLLFLLTLWALGRFGKNRKEYSFFIGCAKDDAFGVILNFGWLFVMAGVIHLMDNVFRALFLLGVGLLNLAWFMRVAPFKAEDGIALEVVPGSEIDVFHWFGAK
ncbi:hypothetical protein [Dyella sp.]|uniref:hypothetical protein n=1 Tax=Dyella sp. TaxID=1869338 RepID=UPI0028452D9F|nr:hypothetical protein [Dyella sp.]MDR3445405.1 hypothetical protein [Dyella sp.]